MKQYINKLLFAAVILITSVSTATAETAVHGVYNIDPNHSTVSFTINHLGFSELTGRFNKFEGTISLLSKKKAKVLFTIYTRDLDTNHAQRDSHLRSPDFFNAKQFPKIKFVSTKVYFNNKGEPGKVDGQLTLRGKTKAVTLAIVAIGAGNDPWGGYRAGYNATTTIKRSQFGMNYMLGGVGDDVHIRLNIEAIKK